MCRGRAVTSVRMRDVDVYVGDRQKWLSAGRYAV